MSFSPSWEQAYEESRQLSRWPWPTLMALTSRYCDFQSKRYRVLELGCGVGANIGYLLSRGVEYFGIDGSQTAVGVLKQQYPNLRIEKADFTKEIPFEGPFDLIFDRAALTHNTIEGVRSCLSQVKAKLSPGGVFIGVDWFSANNDYAKLGKPLKSSDPQCRIQFTEGPYHGIEPVRFFTQEEIQSLVSPLKIIHLEEEVTEHQIPEPKRKVAAWSFVAK